MLALIMALCIGFGGSGSGGLYEEYHCFFDGDVPFVASQPGDPSYYIIKIYSCDTQPSECIWTSEHIPSGGSYEANPYNDYHLADVNEPYTVTCTYHYYELMAVIGSVRGLLWPDDFFPRTGTPWWWRWCTNDF